VTRIKFGNHPPGEYILQSSASGDGNELDNLLLEEALQLVGINDLNVSIEEKPSTSEMPLRKILIAKFNKYVSIPSSLG
jgi:hypothetical protein